MKVRIVPNGLLEGRGTQVFLQMDGGQEMDISRLVQSITWRHRAGELAMCDLTIYAERELNFEPPPEIQIEGRILDVIVGPSPQVGDDISSLADKFRVKKSA